VALLLDRPSSKLAARVRPGELHRPTTPSAFWRGGLIACRFRTIPEGEPRWPTSAVVQRRRGAPLRLQPGLPVDARPNHRSARPGASRSPRRLADDRLMAHRTRGADADHEATLATQAGPGAQGKSRTRCCWAGRKQPLARRCVESSCLPAVKRSCRWRDRGNVGTPGVSPWRCRNDCAGLRQHYVLVDRDAGRVEIIGVWDSAAAVADVAPILEPARQRLWSQFGSNPPLEVFQVADELR
jgi:hypothetical protein